MRVIAVAALALTFAAPARAEFVDHIANPNDVGQEKVPRLGRSRVLVIPLEVRQGGLGAPMNRAKLRTFFEEPSDSELRFPSYFSKQSNARFTPEAVLAPTMYFDACPEELGGTCFIERGDLTVLKDSVGILRTVIARADRGCWTSRTSCDDATAIDFSTFDVNGPRATKDGWVDGVMIVTTMTNVGVALPVYAINDGGDNLAGGVGGAFQVDGVKVPLIALSGDRTAPELVSLHEFGHLLGLGDLYQEPVWSESRPDLQYRGLSGSLMGASDLATGELFDAESRYRLGWSDVEVVSGTKRLTLRPAAQGGTIAKLGVQDPTGRREYYLAEVRRPEGPYDRGFTTRDGAPLAGLALYKVDWSQGPRGTFVRQLIDCLDCNPWHPFIMNVQADRRFDVQEGGPFVPEEDLFLGDDTFQDDRNTAPFSRENKVWGANWYDGTPSGISLKILDVDEQRGWITVEFTAPQAANVCLDLTCASGLSCVAGNCRAPSPVTNNPPAKPKPEEKGDDEGWGCANTSVSALALAALAARRRRIL